MSRKAQIYVAVVISLGCLALLAAAGAWQSVPDARRFLLYVGLTAAASLVKFRLPGITGTYSLNAVFLLAGTVYFSLTETVAAAAVAVLVQLLVNARRRPAAVQVLFNVANESLSVAMGFVCLHALVDGGVLPFRPVLLAVGAAVYFVLNTALVSGILSILEAKALGEVNRQWYYWSFPYYLLGAAVVGLLPLGGQALDPQAWIVLLPLAYLVHFFLGLAGRNPGDERPDGEAAMSMGRATKAYVGAVLVAAAGILVTALAQWPAVNLVRLACFLALALWAATWKVRLPGTSGSVSVHYVVTLVAISQLSLQETLLIAAVGPVVQCLWRPQRRPLPVQVVFSVAAVVVSAAAAFLACRVWLEAAVGGSLLLMLAVAAAVQFLLNTVLVAGVMALAENQPVLQLWRRLYFWTFPAYAVGATAAGLIAITSLAAGWLPALLIVPVLAMVNFSYALHLRGRTGLRSEA